MLEQKKREYVFHEAKEKSFDVIKTSFNNSVERAKFEDARFHDHSHILTPTRSAGCHMPPLLIKNVRL